jgi:hypothetical protein
MWSLELYREVVLILLVASASINLALIPSTYRHRDVLSGTALWCTFASGAAATTGIAIWFRFHDHISQAPFNARDLTILIPSFIFLAAGIVGFRTIGRLVGRHEGAAHVNKRSVLPEHD